MSAKRSRRTRPGVEGLERRETPSSAHAAAAAATTSKVAAVHGKYDGTVAADGNSIKGTWTQGADLPLEFKRTVAAAKPATPSDIDGAWMGVLEMGGAKLHVVFHIFNTAEGLKATLDSPDQGANGIPTSSVMRNGSSLTIEADMIGGKYVGKIAADLSSIDGTWTQGGSTVPLSLKKQTEKDKADLTPKRPQVPVKPYPYKEQDVTYENKEQNVTLAATLTIPEGKGPFPAVLLITGSGPQDRDESLLGHKPFLILSDYLTRHGIAVLRADDRGIGKSTGVFSKATTADFATDTEAGVAYLKARSDVVNVHKIGLIGHSEGGVIAPMIAARNKDVAFIVMMAGTGVPGDVLLPEQVQQMAEASGAPHDAAVKSAAQTRQLIALVEHENDPAALRQKAKSAMPGLPEDMLNAQLTRLSDAWMRYFFAYDPAPTLRHVTCPVLALNGSKDRQVPPSQNLPPIRKALEEGGNQHFDVVELPGLNHLFQTAKTGSATEYQQIEETIAPVALEKISTWILAQ